MHLSSWIKPTENATVIEWKKRRSLMTKLSNGLNPVFFFTQLRIWFRTGSYFIRWHIVVCVWLFKQTNSSLKWTTEVVPSHYFLQGGRFSRVTVINGPTVVFSKIGFLIAGVSLIPSTIPSSPPPLVPILSVLHKELEYKEEKLKNKKFEGHAAKDQSQIRTTTW